MTKSQLISIIKSCDITQAQLWYDHVLTYMQAHKHYPRLRFVRDKTTWFGKVDTDLGSTIQKMFDLGYTKLIDYRMVARALTQYHTLMTPDIVHMPDNITAGTMINNSSVVLHHTTVGIDLIQ
jgi:hypothetical protein